MPNYPTGTVLTCGHGDCGCRIRIEAECHCAGADGSYVCSCGAPMVEVTEADSADQ